MLTEEWLAQPVEARNDLKPESWKEWTGLETGKNMAQGLPIERDFEHNATMERQSSASTYLSWEAPGSTRRRNRHN